MPDSPIRKLQRAAFDCVEALESRVLLSVSIGNFTASPNPAGVGAAITLSATGITDSDSAATLGNVAFYLETDGVTGPQASGDTLLQTLVPDVHV